MGIEQIRMNQTKALPPVPQFNWSQMESNRGNPCSIGGLFSKESRPGPNRGTSSLTCLTEELNLTIDKSTSYSLA
jgi:hypothetical protein